MTQLLFPFILFVSLAAAVMGMLNSRHVFGIPASASTVFNIVSIISGAGLALSVRAAARLAPSALWRTGDLRLVLRRAARRPGATRHATAIALESRASISRASSNFRDSGLRTVLILMVPSAIAGSAVQVNVAVNSQFASHMPAARSRGSTTRSGCVQLPIGIFGVAIATVTLPAVARQHALDDLKAFGKTVEEALRFGFYLTLPASVGLCRHRRAGDPAHLRARHVHRVEHRRKPRCALQAYTIGLAGYSGIKILVPCFYAMQPPRFESTAGASFWQSVSPFCMERRALHAGARQPASASRSTSRSVLCSTITSGSATSAWRMTTGFVAVSTFFSSSTRSRKRSISASRATGFRSSLRVTVATLACGGIVLGRDDLLARKSHDPLAARRGLFFSSISASRARFIWVSRWP